MHCSDNEHPASWPLEASLLHECQSERAQHHGHQSVVERQEVHGKVAHLRRFAL